MGVVKSGVEGVVGRLLLFANLAVAIAACLGTLLVWAAPEALSAPPSEQSGAFRITVRGDGGIGLFALGAALLLVLDVLWLAWGLSPRAPQVNVLSQTDGGPIRVSREALEAGLRAAGEALDDVSRLRVHVEAPRRRSGRVGVRAVFQAREGAVLDRVSVELRTALRERFGQLVRLAPGGRLDVDLEFGGFLGRARGAAEAVPIEPEEAPPFTGPRYPIEGED